MRRSDREISDPEDIFQIFRESDYGILGLSDDGVPYAVPMSCGFFLDNGEPCLCWHSADAGKKIAILRKNPRIVYSCVSECRRDFVPEQSHWSLFYKSACGSGVAEEVVESEQKREMLRLLLQHFGENPPADFSVSMLDRLSVWKCRLLEYTGKHHVAR